jgi:hypothetical protein
VKNNYFKPKLRINGFNYTLRELHRFQQKSVHMYIQWSGGWIWNFFYRKPDVFEIYSILHSIISSSNPNIFNFPFHLWLMANTIRCPLSLKTCAIPMHELTTPTNSRGENSIVNFWDINLVENFRFDSTIVIFLL